MKIYCSGIGGIGLSSYAGLQNAAGHTVLGSDANDSALLDDLRSQGIEIFLEQDGSHVPDDIDLFVYSEAVPEQSPERQRAAALGVEQQSYFRALGELSKDAFVVAVCGTHGKSSTVAMAARVFVELGVDATVQVGTKLKELDGRNWRAGTNDIFLLEACEYRRSFHYLHPNVVLMTNVDGDHFDAYDSVEEYQQAFREFLQQLPEDGVIITHMNDPDCARVVEGLPYAVIDADTEPLPTLSTPGKHMQQNAQLVLSLAKHLSLNDGQTLDALHGYAGSWRRLEHKGTFGNDILVVDDYGHHPREIRATLSALKERYPERRLLCVFQPHTHHRTLRFYDDFTTAFSSADEVVLTEVYEARKDIEQQRVNAVQFAGDIAEHSGVPCSFAGDLSAVEQMVRQEKAQAGDLVLCLGAGTITQLATDLTS